MGTYDTKGGSAISPQCCEPGFAEVELTRAEWQIICGAVGLLADGASEFASDADQVRALAARLKPFMFASAITITLSE